MYLLPSAALIMLSLLRIAIHESSGLPLIVSSSTISKNSTYETPSFPPIIHIEISPPSVQSFVEIVADGAKSLISTMVAFFKHLPLNNPASINADEAVLHTGQPPMAVSGGVTGVVNATLKEASEKPNVTDGGLVSRAAEELAGTAVDEVSTVDGGANTQEMHVIPDEKDPRHPPTSSLDESDRQLRAETNQQVKPGTLNRVIHTPARPCPSDRTKDYKGGCITPFTMFINY